MSPSLKERTERDSSFERLYRLHRRDVYGAVLRDVRDPAEAEDVTQIAFLNAFRAMRKGEEPDKPRAWLVTIARNVIRRRYREHTRRPMEVSLDPDAAVGLADIEGPTAREVTAAIRRLPSSHQQVIMLREIQGRSYAEIAEEMDLSLAAVETLIFRARGKLSEELELEERTPTTQQRRRRGIFVLPLPGFGKLSLGLAGGRLAFTALLGGAIVALPIAGSAADPPRRPAAERAPAVVASTSATKDAPGSKARSAKPAARPPKKESKAAERGDRGKQGSTSDEIVSTGALPVLSESPLPLPAPDEVIGTLDLPAADDVVGTLVPGTDVLPSTEDLPSTDDLGVTEDLPGTDGLVPGGG